MFRITQFYAKPVQTPQQRLSIVAVPVNGDEFTAAGRSQLTYSQNLSWMYLAIIFFPSSHILDSVDLDRLGHPHYRLYGGIGP